MHEVEAYTLKGQKIWGSKSKEGVQELPNDLPTGLIELRYLEY
jgi:hypothetical protein